MIVLDALLWENMGCIWDNNFLCIWVGNKAFHFNNLLVFRMTYEFRLQIIIYFIIKSLSWAPGMSVSTPVSAMVAQICNQNTPLDSK